MNFLIILVLYIIITSRAVSSRRLRKVSKREQEALDKQHRNAVCCEKNMRCCVKPSQPPPIEIRAVLARCPNTKTEKDSSITRFLTKPVIQANEHSLKSFQGFDEDEPLAQSRVTQCRRKVLMTLKMHHNGAVNTKVQYIVIDHVFDPLTEKSVRLLNPYVIKLRQEQVSKSFYLKFVDYVNSEAYEKIYNKHDGNYTGCYADKARSTCGVVKYDGKVIPYSEGFCCSCDAGKNAERQPDSVNAKNEAIISLSDPAYLLDRVQCPRNHLKEDSPNTPAAATTHKCGTNACENTSSPKRWSYTMYSRKEEVTSPSTPCSHRYLKSGVKRKRDDFDGENALKSKQQSTAESELNPHKNNQQAAQIQTGNGENVQTANSANFQTANAVNLRTENGAEYEIRDSNGQVLNPKQDNAAIKNNENEYSSANAKSPVKNIIVATNNQDSAQASGENGKSPTNLPPSELESKVMELESRLQNGNANVNEDKNMLTKMAQSVLKLKDNDMEINDDNFEVTPQKADTADEFSEIDKDHSIHVAEIKEDKPEGKLDGVNHAHNYLHDGGKNAVDGSKSPAKETQDVRNGEFEEMEGVKNSAKESKYVVEEAKDSVDASKDYVKGSKDFVDSVQNSGDYNELERYANKPNALEWEYAENANKNLDVDPEIEESSEFSELERQNRDEVNDEIKNYEDFNKNYADEYANNGIKDNYQQGVKMKPDLKDKYDKFVENTNGVNIKDNYQQGVDISQMYSDLKDKYEDFNEKYADEYTNNVEDGINLGLKDKYERFNAGNEHGLKSKYEKRQIPCDTNGIAARTKRDSVGLKEKYEEATLKTKPMDYTPSENTIKNKYEPKLKRETILHDANHGNDPKLYYVNLDDGYSGGEDVVLGLGREKEGVHFHENQHDAFDYTSNYQDSNSSQESGEKIAPSASKTNRIEVIHSESNKKLMNENGLPKTNRIEGNHKAASNKHVTDELKTNRVEGHHKAIHTGGHKQAAKFKNNLKVKYEKVSKNGQNSQSKLERIESDDKSYGNNEKESQFETVNSNEQKQSDLKSNDVKADEMILKDNGDESRDPNAKSDSIKSHEDNAEATKSHNMDDECVEGIKSTVLNDASVEGIKSTGMNDEREEALKSNGINGDECVEGIESKSMDNVESKSKRDQDTPTRLEEYYKKIQMNSRKKNHKTYIESVKKAHQSGDAYINQIKSIFGEDDIFAQRLIRKIRQTFPSGIQKRGRQNCADRYTPPGFDPEHYHESAHCLRFSEVWYGIYKLGDPFVEQSIYINIYERFESETNPDKWREITNQTLHLGNRNPIYEDETPTISITLSTETANETTDEYSNLHKKRILIPEGIKHCDVARYPEMKNGADEYLVVNPDQIALEGDQCDRIGVGFEAFFKQPLRCGVPRSTCLHNQPKQLWRHDKALEKNNEKGCYFLKYHANVTKDPILINYTTGDKYLDVEYRGEHTTIVDIEIKADFNAIIRQTTRAVISEVYVDSTCEKITTIIVKVINSGLISNRFLIQLSDFPLEIPSEFSKIKSKLTLISPQNQHIFTLEVRHILPSELLFCSIEVLNCNHELVALRRIRIQKYDRCICTWHCLCACVASSAGLKCNPMSLEHYHAAGFQGSLPIVTYMVHFTLLDDLISVVFYFALFLLVVLLLMGLCKSMLGRCFPFIGLWGLPVLLDLPKHMKHYYEPELRKESVVYDPDGWPVHPTTKKRVRNISRSTEFCTNLVFFFIYPLAGCLMIFRRLCCSYYTKKHSHPPPPPPVQQQQNKTESDITPKLESNSSSAPSNFKKSPTTVARLTVSNAKKKKSSCCGFCKKKTPAGQSCDCNAKRFAHSDSDDKFLSSITMDTTTTAKTPKKHKQSKSSRSQSQSQSHSHSHSLKSRSSSCSCGSSVSSSSRRFSFGRNRSKSSRKSSTLTTTTLSEKKRKKTAFAIPLEEERHADKCKDKPKRPKSM